MTLTGREREGGAQPALPLSRPPRPCRYVITAAARLSALLVA